MKSKTHTIIAISSLLFSGLSQAEITGNLAAGYSTGYEFRGSILADDLAESTFALSSPLADSGITLGDSLWYASGNGSSDFVNNELDYSLYLSKTIAGTTFSLGHIYYSYPEFAETNTAEIYLTVSRELFAGITGTVTAYYDYDLFDGWFFYADLGKSFKLNDCVTLNLNAGLGDFQSYAGFNNGINHYYAKAALAWAPRQNLTITPYVKFTDAASDFPADFTTASGDLGGTNVIGGVGVSVAF